MPIMSLLNRNAISLLAVSALITLVAARSANGDPGELERAGFLGHWAQNCKKAASPTNWHYIVQLAKDGSITDSAFSGAGAPDLVTSLIFVRRVGRNQIEVESYYVQPKSPDVVNLTITVERDRHQTTRAVSPSDGEIIRDGRFVNGGQPVPWLHRCSGASIS